MHITHYYASYFDQLQPLLRVQAAIQTSSLGKWAPFNRLQQISNFNSDHRWTNSRFWTFWRRFKDVHRICYCSAPASRTKYRQCANLERVHLRSFQPVQSPSDRHQRPNTKRIKALQITTGTECTFVQTCATCASRSALCFQCERFQSFSPTGACDATGQLTLSVACDFSVQAAPPFQSLRLAKYFKQFAFLISISHLFSWCLLHIMSTSG